MKLFSSADVRRLLHNKYVAILGDFIQRSVYKDFVKILQNDEFLTENQLKRKGEMSFANDLLGDLWSTQFHFHFELRFRVEDATHSNQLANWKYTCILMAHIAQAWGL
uniref:Uncharacterized protein n=1 Tax=Pyxicephalus adspersus TaxID=30357 RepID=A0AAV2ZPB2_PYXAD|nr:TPA: hypothetical protein GDO54_003382 [Pyxicephalus adspersus]